MKGEPIRVLVATGDPADVPNFYRTVGPLLADGKRYEVRAAGEERSITWLDLADIDVLCIPRCSTDGELRILELAKAAKVTTWVDYDDDLLNVPESSPAFVEYVTPAVRQNILLALAEADLVTVSTGALREVLQPARAEGARDVKVVRNGLHPRWPKRALFHNRSDMFAWRGSATHIEDVRVYAEAIAAGIPASATFQMLGWFAYPLALAVGKKNDNVHYTKELPINMYFRELEAAGIAAMIVPLVDNDFNRSKSNVAQLEALSVGALSIVPDWPEWQLPGSFR